MLYVLHDDNTLGFVDPVKDAPLGTEACAMEPSQLASKRLSDAVRSLHERADDKFHSSGGCFLRKEFGNRAPRRAGQSEFVRVVAQCLRSASSARAASAP